MCIICVSAAGVSQPTHDQIKIMFDRNPHGAGYMVARKNRVEIHKGFMELEDLQRQLERENFTADDVVVYHFRISTQAGVKETMTHPFPLTSNLAHCEALDLTCACGVAHNGVIRLTSNGSTRYSDTALFITQYMTKVVRRTSDLQDPAVLRILEELAKSKLAILDKTGQVATVGSFIHEKNGLLFSNATYREFTSPFGNLSRYPAFALRGGV